MLIAHYLQSRLLKRAEKFPVVTSPGPRQPGKTTLTRMALPGHKYMNLDPGERRWATDDPRSTGVRCWHNTLCNHEPQT